jgi:hypothetical protein
MRLRVSKSEFESLLLLFLYEALRGDDLLFSNNRAGQEAVTSLANKNIDVVLRKFWASSDAKSRVNLKRVLSALELNQPVGIEIEPSVDKERKGSFHTWLSRNKEKTE